MWTKSPTLAECTGVNNSNKDGTTGKNTGGDFADTLLDSLEEPKTLPTPADAALEMSHEPIDRGTDPWFGPAGAAEHEFQGRGTVEQRRVRPGTDAAVDRIPDQAARVLEVVALDRQ